MHGAVHRFHRRVREEGDLVGCLDLAGCARYGFLGIANGLSLGSLATSTYDVVPAHARGRLQAARRTVAEIGGVAAPLFGGYLADTFNPGVPFLVYAPLLILSAVLLALVGRETLAR